MFLGVDRLSFSLYTRPLATPPLPASPLLLTVSLWPWLDDIPRLPETDLATFYSKFCVASYVCGFRVVTILFLVFSYEFYERQQGVPGSECLDHILSF